MLTIGDMFADLGVGTGPWTLAQRPPPAASSLGGPADAGKKLLGFILGSSNLGYNGVLQVIQDGWVVATVDVGYGPAVSWFPLELDLASPVRFVATDPGTHFDAGPMALACYVTDETGEIDMQTFQELAAAACVANSDVALVGRLNTALLGVVAAGGAAAKITGIMLRCGEAGYLVGRVGSLTVFTVDMTIANAMLDFLDVDIDLKPGETFSLAAHSTASTGAAAATVRYQQ